MRRHSPVVRSLLGLGAVVGLVAVAAPAGVDGGGAASGPGDRLSARHSRRAAVTDESFYFVMADRFANGDPSNDTAGIPGGPLQHGFDPTARGFYQGGDLAGLHGRLDYLEGLGTTAIWLTPSFENKPVQLEDGPSAGYHGYWVTDFTQIDPHLGTNAELRALVDDAHARGMKVYFDIITNHTADVIGYAEGARTAYVPKDVAPYLTAAGVPFDDRDVAGSRRFPSLDPVVSFPYTPVLDPSEVDLKVPDWLNRVELYHNRGNTTFTGEDSYYGDFFGLDDLFTEHPVVVQGMIDVYTTWIGELGIDGFRIDTMKHVDSAFWQRFGPSVLDYARRQGKDEFFMFGEVFDTSRSFTSQFTTTDQIQAVLDFPFQEAARDFASRGLATDRLGAFFVADDWYTDVDSNVYQLPTFLGNHDMGRIGHFVAADNPGAQDAELLARDRLAHELMYLSRGNPVVYYGDEQGFTGDGGDQLARQSMFASQVADYLDDDLLGTDATHAEDRFEADHPLYEAIAELAALAAGHPALRDGAHQHRWSDDGPGLYSFSRIDRRDGHEYVVALNNSEAAATAAVPTFVPDGDFARIYGDGATELRSGPDRALGLTVPALSTVVYRSVAAIPRSPSAPTIALGAPQASAATRSRVHVAASVDGTSFYEVTFYARAGNGQWRAVGTDDTAPYQVFHDTSDVPAGTSVSYRAVLRDNAGHTAASREQAYRVPVPMLSVVVPEDGGEVTRLAPVTVQAAVDPERSDQVVAFERSVDGGPWERFDVDDSSPAYTTFDDVSSFEIGTVVAYRAVLIEPPASRDHERADHRHRRRPVPARRLGDGGRQPAVRGRLPRRLATRVHADPPRVRPDRRHVAPDVHAARRLLRVEGRHRRLVVRELRIRRSGAMARTSSSTCPRRRPSPSSGTRSPRCRRPWSTAEPSRTTPGKGGRSRPGFGCGGSAVDQQAGMSNSKHSVGDISSAEPLLELFEQPFVTVGGPDPGRAGADGDDVAGVGSERRLEHLTALVDDQGGEQPTVRGPDLGRAVTSSGEDAGAVEAERGRRHQLTVPTKRLQQGPVGGPHPGRGVEIPSGEDASAVRAEHGGVERVLAADPPRPRSVDRNRGPRRDDPVTGCQDTAPVGAEMDRDHRARAVDDGDRRSRSGGCEGPQPGGAVVGAGDADAVTVGAERGGEHHRTMEHRGHGVRVGLEGPHPDDTVRPRREDPIVVGSERGRFDEPAVGTDLRLQAPVEGPHPGRSVPPPGDDPRSRRVELRRQHRPVSVVEDDARVSVWPPHLRRVVVDTSGDDLGPVRAEGRRGDATAMAGQRGLHLGVNHRRPGRPHLGRAEVADREDAAAHVVEHRRRDPVLVLDPEALQHRPLSNDPDGRTGADVRRHDALTGGIERRREGPERGLDARGRLPEHGE